MGDGGGVGVGLLPASCPFPSGMIDSKGTIFFVSRAASPNKGAFIFLCVRLPAASAETSRQGGNGFLRPVGPPETWSVRAGTRLSYGSGSVVRDTGLE